MKNPKSSSSRKEQIKEKRRKEQRQQRLIIVLVAAGLILIIGALILGPTIRNATAPVGDIVKITPEKFAQAKFNTVGDPNAPVKMEEYSDYQCPYCKLFNDETEPRIFKDYVETGKVYFVYHSMGLFIGPESVQAAQAAYCAGDQNQFWAYHDMLFANQNGENLGNFSDKRLNAFAGALGLDTGAFQSCLSSGKYKSLVNDDQAKGTQLGVSSTPSFFINGKKVEGAPGYDTFKAALDAALAGR